MRVLIVVVLERLLKTTIRLLKFGIPVILQMLVLAFLEVYPEMQNELLFK